MKLRVLLASSSHLALPLLKVLEADSRMDFIGLLSTPDRSKGRHGTPSPNELVTSLSSRNIRIWTPETHEDLLDVVTTIQPDLVFVIAYGRLISRELIDAVPRGWINLHFSSLPSFRGAAPVQRSILAGEERFGFTYFRIDEGMDSGPIYLQQDYLPSKTASATEILEELAEMGSSALSEVVSMVMSEHDPWNQSGTPTFAPKISKNELKLDTQATADTMLRQIRAFTKSPGVWFELNGRRCIITSATFAEVAVASDSIAFIDNRALLGSGERSIEILRIKPEGKREMSGLEWLRGLHFAPGESRRLGQLH